MSNALFVREAEDFGKGLAKEGVPRKVAQDIIEGKYGFRRIVVGHDYLDEVALRAYDSWLGLAKLLWDAGATAVVKAPPEQNERFKSGQP